VKVRLVILFLATMLIAASAETECCRGTVPGATDTLSAAARAMRARARAEGISGNCLPWRTPEEVREWKRTMPEWMKKISQDILNLVRLLKENDVLVAEHRPLAAQFSTDRVPVDSLGRINVECRISTQSYLTRTYFQNSCGKLLGIVTPPHSASSYCDVWICPEALQSLAERSDVLFIDALPASAH